MHKVQLFIERVAALLLGAVAVVTVVEVLLRQVFGLRIPDAYTLAGYLQGTAVMWGIAVAVLAGRHIAVDLLWELSPGRRRRLIDLGATAVAALFFLAMAAMIFVKVERSRRNFESTLDLGWPIWPLLVLGAVGAGFAVVAAIMRLRQIAVTDPAELESQAAPVAVDA